MQPHPTPHRGGPRRGPTFLLLGLIGCSPWAPKEQPTPVWEDSASPDSGADVPDADGDGHPADEDCDDADATIHPGADESPDGVDEDAVAGRRSGRRAHGGALCGSRQPGMCDGWQMS